MSMFAAIAFAVALAAPAAAGDAPAKPWDKEEGCRWWLSADDGKSLRASIGQGDEGLVLSIADPVFLEFSEEDRPKVELIFDDDPRRRVAAAGWSSHIGTETAIFGLELKAAGLRKLAGAQRLDFRRKGRTYLTLPLAATPSRAELKACMPGPLRNSDQE